MRRRFRITLLLSMALICLCLYGCGTRQSGEAGQNELLVVGFSQLGSESSWRIANTASMTQENQLAAVRNFILQGVDMIVIAPTEETGWDSVLQEAKNAGIPVIIMDRSVSVEDGDLYLSSVGSDFLRE